MYAVGGGSQVGSSEREKRPSGSGKYLSWSDLFFGGTFPISQLVAL